MNSGWFQRRLKIFQGRFTRLQKSFKTSPLVPRGSEKIQRGFEAVPDVFQGMSADFRGDCKGLLTCFRVSFREVSGGIQRRSNMFMGGLKRF